MSFQKQKDAVIKFYEDTNDVVDQHKQTYTKLVNKLNEKTGVTQTLNNNLDTFMEFSFTDFNTFKETINSQPLEDTEITHVFDINKNEYLTDFNLPNKKIVIKQNFRCHLMQNKPIILQNNCQPCIYIDSIIKCRKPTTTYVTRNYISNSTKCILETNGIRKICNCNDQCGDERCRRTGVSRHSWETEMKQIFNNSHSYSKKEQKTLEFYIDDYFNIYIPSLKTYLVYNYFKFPLYSFYMNMDKLNLYHNNIVDGIRHLMYNEDCPDDLAEYNLVKSFVDASSDFLTSADKRLHFKTLFPDLLKFYQYDVKQAFFTQFQTLSEKLQQLALDGASITLEEEAEITDESKIFAQSQRIRELEITNTKYLEEIECLRNERTIYIAKEHKFNSKIEDYNKLLEELNNQLSTEIDKVAIKEKEIIQLKTSILESTELKHQYRTLEDSFEATKIEISKMDTELSKLKILNNTLVDKQIQYQQKINIERNKVKEQLDVNLKLQHEIQNYNIKIKELEKTIHIEQEQHIITKKKVDEMISNLQKDETVNDCNDDIQYQEILLTQLKEKNDDIVKLQSINKQLNNDIQQSKKEFTMLKSKVSALIK